MLYGPNNFGRRGSMMGDYNYANPYPEFGQLLRMLLEFLASYFKSLFSGASSNSSTPENSDHQPEAELGSNNDEFSFDLSSLSSLLRFSNNTASSPEVTTPTPAVARHSNSPRI